jgi:hypothetical protein
MFEWLKKKLGGGESKPVDPHAPPSPGPQPVPVTLGPSWLAYLKWAAWIVTAVAAVGTFVFEWRRDGKLPDKLPDIPPPPIQQPSAVLPVGQGWVSDPEAVEAVLDTLPAGERLFGDTPAGRAVMGDDQDIYLWDACRKVTGDRLPARNQGTVGSCVAFGTGSAVEHLLCVQIATGGRGEFRPLVQEVIYGGSRVEVGNGRIKGDGSVGGWAAKWVRDWGVVSRGTHGRHDLSQYSESRCRDWGRSGVPDELEPVARESPVKGVSLVKSAEEARRALAQGYPIAVCSRQGFSMSRDRDGFASAQGEWAHCMAITGYSAGPRRGFYVLNSWGPDAHTGPTGKGDPGTAGFWADWRVLDRMLAGEKNEGWAFSDAAGFPARKLDWTVRRPADPFALALAP